MYRIFTTNREGKIEFTKQELQDFIKEVEANAKKEAIEEYKEKQFEPSISTITSSEPFDWSKYNNSHNFMDYVDSTITSTPNKSTTITWTSNSAINAESKDTSIKDIPFLASKRSLKVGGTSGIEHEVLSND